MADRHLGRIAHRIVGVLLVGVLLASCTSGDGDTGAEEPPERRAGEAPVIVPGTLQQLWVVERAVAIDAEGGEMDVTDDLVAFADGELDEQAELTSRTTFTASARFRPQLLDVGGVPLETVRMHGGVVETAAGARRVAVLATTDPGESTIGKNTTLRLDLPEEAGVGNGWPVVVDYVYLQYLPVEGATGFDEEQSPLDLLARRSAAGAVAFRSDGEDDTVVMTGEVGVARSSAATGEVQAQGASRAVPYRSGPAQEQGRSDGKRSTRPRSWELAREHMEEKAKERLVEIASERIADRIDVPADAVPFLEGLAEGAAETLGRRCLQSITCVENFLDKVQEGFEESWDLIDEELTFERCGGREPCDDDQGSGGSDGGPGSGSTGGDGWGLPGSGSGSGSSSGSGSGSTSSSGSASGPGSGSGPGSDTGSDRSGPDTGSSGPSTGSSGTDGSSGPSTGSTGSSGPSTGSSGPDTGSSGPSSGSSGGGGGGGGGGGRIRTDPHLTTFDGRDYSLQVVGELTAAQLDDLEVQVRFEAVPCSCPASVTTAAVVASGDHRVQVDLYDQWVVRVDGDRVDLDDPDGSSVVGTGSLTVVRTPGGVEITESSSGDAVTVSIGSTFLNVALDSDRSGWVGLFGDANGLPDDDFRLRDGTQLGSMPSPATIEGEFADSWRITDDTSHFTYEDGESTATFADAEFPAPHPTATRSELEANREIRTAQATTVCSMAGITDETILADCVFDFTSTGSPAIVRGNRQAELASGRSGPPRGSSSPSLGAGEVHFEGVSQVAGPVPHLVTGHGLVLVRVRNDAANTVALHAIDAATRREAWLVPSVDGECDAVALDGSLAAVAPGDDGQSLVLLDPADGGRLAELALEDPIEQCHALTGEGDVVVARFGPHLQAFRVADATIEPLWSHRADEDGLTLRTVDGHIVLIGWADGAVRASSFDPEDGEVVASWSLPAGPLLSVRDVGDARLAIVLGTHPSVDQPATLVLLDAGGGELDAEWVRRNGDDDPDLPAQVARLGDLLVGWSHHAKGDGLIAYSRADGSEVWTHAATSFDNTNGLVAATSDVAIISPFGGAWLELVGGDGETTTTIEEKRAHARTITVLDDEAVVVTGAAEGGGIYLVFVDL